MILTAASVARYLLGPGLMKASDIVDGELRIASLSRRNCVFRVTFFREGRNRGYVVKQVREWTPENIRTLEREARFYWLMRNDPRFAPLAPYVPECYAYDSRDQVLVMELVQHAESSSASVVGNALRQWHDIARDAARPLHDDFDSQPPWAFSMHEANDDPEAVGAANVELLGILRRHEGFGRALAELREQWPRPAERYTLIHGDMKANHCILESGHRLRIVDWEMAKWGDPLWDAAGIMHEYLSTWARGGARSSATLSIQDFWSAYTVGLEDRAQQELRPTLFAFAAVRMIQSVWELHKKAPAMTAPGIRMLQASLNILAAPADAAAVFL